MLVRLLICCVVLSAALTTEAQQRQLSFAERVAAQEAIERVVYSHQLGTSRSFDNAVPRQRIEDKVRELAMQSAALDALFGTRVTAEALERELARIERGTRMPHRLKELYAALNHDRVLILESIARPALVKRLLRNALEYEGRAHQDRFQRPPGRKKDWSAWWSTHRERFAGATLATVAAGSDSTLVPDVQEGTNSTMELPLVDGLHSAAAVDATPFGAWDNGSLDDVPDPFAFHAAVWTGTTMIVWGGRQDSNRGFLYDPLIDVWMPISSVGAPASRQATTAVWTGTEMIVWGGRPILEEPLSTGGRYDPATDTWRPVSTDGAPTERLLHTAVWTGERMIVWGGELTFSQQLDTGGVYDPATDSWTPTSTEGAPSPRRSHTAIWTGEEMIVWGGTTSFSSNCNDGARYDPATDSWTPITVADAPSERASHSAVWTGEDMIVWGGLRGSSFRDTGGRYDPVTDSWTPTDTTGAPSRRAFHSAVWTGAEMIVWGGTSSSSSGLDDGGRYDPTTDRWTPTSTLGAPGDRSTGQTAVWTGAEMIVWGGFTSSPSIRFFNTGARYDPDTDTWTPTSTGDAPTERGAVIYVWTGNVMIVWGGDLGFSPPVATGSRYDPVLDQWTPTSTTDAPAPRSFTTAVWTGQEMIVWGGLRRGSGTVRLDTGGRYDPILDRWQPTSTTGAPEPRFRHTAVWTGTEMIVWGGSADSGIVRSGGRYDPANDSWIATSLDQSPIGRSEHTAVWTGSEMIVWGGLSFASTPDSGGRYDPASDAWALLSPVGEPDKRRNHSAVWVGGRMAIWGGAGGSPSDDCCDVGGLYDPATDSWTEMTAVDAPPRTFSHRAVVAGDRMIVWGGASGAPPVYRDTGGIYDVLLDEWTLTSTVEPATARRSHAAVWTGDAMLVWGGYAGNNLRSGGLFFPESNQPPVALCIDVTVSAGSDCTADASIDAGSFDPDGDPITVSQDPPGPYGLDDTLVTLTVTDDEGASGSCMATVTVEDTTAPQHSVVLAPDTLWPPNHQMVEITAAVTASDNCTTPSVLLTSLTSNEADDGLGIGDGKTNGDIQPGADDFHFSLRAERAGTGSGRIYTAVYTATDGAGNAVVEAGFVVVPHNQGGVIDPVAIVLEQSASGTLVSWDEVPGARSYDVIRGELSNIVETNVVINLGPVTCIEPDSTDESTAGWEDSNLPDPGQAFFYLVQYDDGTSSTYGTESADLPRVPGPGDCQ